MKLTTLVLAGSLALNVLLLAARIAHPSGKSGGDVPTAAPTNPAKSAAAIAPPAAPPVSAESLLALEPVALRTELQRLKLPPETVDALVIARIYARHDARRRELMLATNQL